MLGAEEYCEDEGNRAVRSGAQVRPFWYGEIWIDLKEWALLKSSKRDMN